MKTYRRNV